MKVGATEVEICLHLVVSQVRGDFKVRDPRMADYLKLVRSLQTQFGLVNVTQISRGQNNHADSLATLASSVGSSIPLIISMESLESPSITHRENCRVAAIAVSLS